MPNSSKSNDVQWEPKTKCTEQWNGTILKGHLQTLRCLPPTCCGGGHKWFSLQSRSALLTHCSGSPPPVAQHFRIFPQATVCSLPVLLILTKVQQQDRRREVKQPLVEYKWSTGWTGGPVYNNLSSAMSFFFFFFVPSNLVSADKVLTGCFT